MTCPPLLQMRKPRQNNLSKIIQPVAGKTQSHSQD